MGYDTTKTQPYQSIVSDLEATRKEFHTLIQTLSDEDLKAKSKNPGWNNGEILFHMLLGFRILNSLLPMARFSGRLPKSFSRPFRWILNNLTGLFNRVNALGARGGGRYYDKRRVAAGFDKTIESLLKKTGGIKDNEWLTGMYYPTKWDALFDDYMTIEKLFHYPGKHFRFHAQQIRTGHD